MTKFVSATAFACAFTLTLPAAALASENMDADGDGAVSMSEFQTAHPEADTGIFTAVDANADGVLTADEITAAQEAGTLPNG
ncbi:MAG: EF-hand domain-containing protein [Roseovarius sp.]